MSVRVCVHVSGHVVGSEGEQELTDMLTSQNTLWCINIHTRLCTLINLPREAASCTSTWFGQCRTAALDFDFLLVSTVLGAGLIGAAFDEFKDERVLPNYINRFKMSYIRSKFKPKPLVGQSWPRDCTRVSKHVLQVLVWNALLWHEIRPAIRIISRNLKM